MSAAPKLQQRGQPQAAILLVDDEEDIRAMAAPWLRQQGFVVGVAAGGEEAIAALSEGGWDGVVLDLMMPGLDGWAVWDFIQALPGPRVPVVIWTASGLRTGAVGDAPIVSKGDRPELLVEALRARIGV